MNNTAQQVIAFLSQLLIVGGVVIPPIIKLTKSITTLSCTMIENTNAHNEIKEILKDHENRIRHIEGGK